MAKSTMMARRTLAGRTSVNSYNFLSQVDFGDFYNGVDGYVRPPLE
jgi:hypothetical protein